MPTKKNPEFWIITYEGWGDEGDFTHVDGDMADTPLQALNLMTLSGRETAHGEDIIRDYAARSEQFSSSDDSDDYNIFVYRMELAGVFRYVPPTARLWKKVQ